MKPVLTVLAALAIVISAGMVLWQADGSNTAVAAENDINALASENAALKQILDVVGKGPINVYAHFQDMNNDMDPTLKRVKMLPPKILFGKMYLRFKKDDGSVVMVGQEDVGSIEIVGTYTQEF